MDIFINIILLVIIALLGMGLLTSNNKVTELRKSNTIMEDKIREITKAYNDSTSEIIDLEHRIVEVNGINYSLETNLKTFITERIKVYVNSNFHSNYNIYNGKFYAKISKSPTSTRIEAIPVLPIQGNKYYVIDIYKLKRLQKLEPDTSILSHIEASKTQKENMIQELGNKVLTSYQR